MVWENFYAIYENIYKNKQAQKFYIFVLIKTNYALRTFLPFFLLLDKIDLPALVDILARKPCVLFRLRLLGWKVLFIILSGKKVWEL